MARLEHLDQFKRGKNVWNEWRKEHPEIRPDLSGIEADDLLERMDSELGMYDLRGVILQGANIGLLLLLERSYKEPISVMCISIVLVSGRLI